LPNSVTWDFSTRYSLATPGLAAFLAGEDMDAMSPPAGDVVCTLSGSIRHVAWGNDTRVFIFVKDTADAYDSGSLPGNVAGRTVAGTSISVPGLASGHYSIERWNPYTGILVSTGTNALAVAGVVTISPAAIDRSVAFKVYRTGP
jgi:hypothetical protein